METKTETVQPESIETQVAKWSATDAALLMAVEATRGIAVADHVEGPKKGREAVHRALMDLSSRRTAIESRREELKRPILNLGKLVDSEAEAARIAAEAPDREKIALEVETWRNEAPEDPGIESDDLREVFGVFVESIRKQMNEFLSALKENA